MRCIGLVERNLWLQVEPHLDSRFFNHPFGSSYLNTTAFNTKLMMRYWRDRNLATRIIGTQLPRVRMNTFTVSEAGHGNALLAEADPEVPSLLRRHLQSIAEAFHSTMTPDAYAALNQRLWDALQDLLRPRAQDKDFAPWSYPFTGLWVELTIGSSGLPDKNCSRIIAVDEVLRIARHVIGNSEVDADTTFMDAGLDSIGAVELRSQLEAAAGSDAELPNTIIFEAPTARQVVATLNVSSQTHTARCTTVADVLRVARHVIGDSGLDADMSFTHAGLDSISAVELRSQLEVVSGGQSDLPATLVFEAPTARQVIEVLNGSLYEQSYVVTAQTSAPAQHEFTLVDPGTPTGGTLILLHHGPAVLPLVVFSSTWGNVDHYQRLAMALQGPVWGVEHTFLRSGSHACMAPRRLEEAANATAEAVMRSCMANSVNGFHGLGGSYGALMAQKVGVAALGLGGVVPAWVILVDPPPAGPCTRGFTLPGLILASQIVRLGREIAGLDASPDTLRQLMGRPEEDWAHANEVAATNSEAADVVDADEDWALALVATEQLAIMGQVQFNGRGIERTKRRMDVFRKCMQLWHHQEAKPVAYVSSSLASGMILVTSTRRWNFYQHLYDIDSLDNLNVYGDVHCAIELEGEHTAVVQAMCTNQLRQVTAAIRLLLE